VLSFLFCSMNALSSFIRYIKFEKRFSPHTVEAYESDLEQFFTFLNVTYGETEIVNITHPMIRSWIVSMMESRTTPRSINRKLSSLKSFYKFLLRSETIKINPMQKIQAPKTSKRLPVFVEESSMKLLFEEVDFGEGFAAVRDRLIMEVFYATGMRVSELVNLKEKDIDLTNSQVKVLGKRNKERIIPYTIVVRQMIQGYRTLKSKQTFSHSCENLFVDKNGKALTRIKAYDLVKKYLSAVSTLDKKSPHVLRHTFATHMLNHGADINSIKEILGHANLGATQVYTHNTIEKLKQVYKQAHPRA
jgi:integrase/recombinase XerC